MANLEAYKFRLTSSNFQREGLIHSKQQGGLIKTAKSYTIKNPGFRS